MDKLPRKLHDFVFGLISRKLTWKRIFLLGARCARNYFGDDVHWLLFGADKLFVAAFLAPFLFSVLLLVSSLLLFLGLAQVLLPPLPLARAEADAVDVGQRS